jgi:hypothetical protein
LPKINKAGKSNPAGKKDKTTTTPTTTSMQPPTLSDIESNNTVSGGGSEAYEEGGGDDTSSMSEIPMERGETGASLPTPDEVRMDTGTGRSSGSRATTWRCYILFFLVLLVGLIGLGIGLAARGDSGNSGSSGSSINGGSSSSQPRKFSIEDLAAYLEQSGVTSSNDIFDMTSPQSDAAAWMANQDGRNLPLPTTVGQPEDYRFVQRYVLATLYYAMKGNDWLLDSNFLSNDDACAWRTTRLNRNGERVNFGVLCDAETNTNILALYLGTCGL